jgi:hypothetical protein
MSKIVVKYCTGEYNEFIVERWRICEGCLWLTYSNGNEVLIPLAQINYITHLYDAETRIKYEE